MMVTKILAALLLIPHTKGECEDSVDKFWFTGAMRTCADTKVINNKGWACKSNPQVKGKCLKLCDLCPSDDCVDSTAQFWFQDGMKTCADPKVINNKGWACKSNPQVKGKCLKLCDLCESTEDPDCVDSTAQFWFQNGMKTCADPKVINNKGWACKSNPQVKGKCLKLCDLCESTEDPDCVDSTAQFWFQDSMKTCADPKVINNKGWACKSNPQIMEKCLKLCDLCESTEDPPTATPTTDETCVDLSRSTDCEYWESQGYCTHSYVEYMAINCRKSCRLCISPTNVPAVTPTATPTTDETCVDLSGSTDCEYWESQGYCTHSYVEYMAINCRKSCRFCTLAPTPEPLLKRTGLSCKSNNDCKSGYCDEATKICYETDKCKAIRHSPFSEFRKNKVIVIIVGSGFTDLTVWKNQAVTVFSSFEKFPFFEASVDEYVAFYVNELNDSFCYYGCFDGTAVDRLLCCEVRAARTLGDMCFPYVSGVQTVVVHNDLQYGGAGQISDDIATTSITSSSPLLAVHELGHSLFTFQDEYDWDYAGTDRGPNCDSTPGCPRWNDILESYPDACSYKGCGGSNYWISEPSSFMRVLNTNVGPVLRRFTCCTYLAITGQIPLYCNEFLNLGDGLINFCQASGYINDQTLLPKNEIIESSEEVCSEGSSIFLPSRKFICITSSMIRLILDVFSLDKSDGELSILSSQTLQSGYIPSSQIYGDYENESSVSEAGEDKVIKINITSASGVTETRLYSAFVLISAPPLHEAVKNLDGALSVKLKRASIEIVVDKAQWDDGIQVSGKLSQVLPHF